jgi:hypothetical protein
MHQQLPPGNCWVNYPVIAPLCYVEANNDANRLLCIIVCLTIASGAKAHFVSFSLMDESQTILWLTLLIY